MRNDPFAIEETTVVKYEPWTPSLTFDSPEHLLDMAQQMSMKSGWDVHHCLCALMGVADERNPTPRKISKTVKGKKDRQIASIFDHTTH